MELHVRPEQVDGDVGEHRLGRELPVDVMKIGRGAQPAQARLVGRVTVVQVVEHVRLGERTAALDELGGDACEAAPTTPTRRVTAPRSSPVARTARVVRRSGRCRRRPSVDRDLAAATTSPSLCRGRFPGASGLSVVTRTSASACSYLPTMNGISPIPARSSTQRGHARKASGSDAHHVRHRRAERQRARRVGSGSAVRSPTRTVVGSSARAVDTGGCAVACLRGEPWPSSELP